MKSAPGESSRESLVGKTRRCNTCSLYFSGEFVIGVLLDVSRKQWRVFHHVTHLDGLLARKGFALKSLFGAAALCNSVLSVVFSW
jgi:hypothetical protein